VKSWRQKSYEVLPALSLRGPELRKSLRIVTIGYACSIVWYFCASGSQVKTFARMLGFNDFLFGILATVPYIATFGQIWMTVIIERTGLRKYQFIDLLTVSRLLWVVVAAIPLVFAVPSKLAMAAMLVALAASHALTAMGAPAWWSWMGDLIPRRLRGRYMAGRERVGRIVQILTVIIIVVILDAVATDGAPETARHQPLLLWTICGIFVVAAAFGTIDILLFHRIRELMPSVRDRPRRPAVTIDVPRPRRRTVASLASYWCRCTGSACRQVLVEPMGDKPFRAYVIYGTAITFSMTVGGWYYWRNATENLGFSMLAANVLFLGIGPLAGFVAVKAWGGAMDRWGRRPVLIVATSGTLFSVMPWLLAARGTAAPDFVVSAMRWAGMTAPAPMGAYLLGIIACIIGGASWSGVNLAQSGIILGFSDGDGRSKYVAASSVLISLGGVLGGLAGGAITQSLGFLRESPIIAGPFLWNNWHAAFVVSMLGRAVAFVLLIGMPDPGSGRTRDMLRYVGMNVYNALFPRLFYRVRIFGWRRRRRDRNNGRQ